jgi:DMSO/TMAO reductase YedYZ molybdopterin-dependent catalytic subunit
MALADRSDASLRVRIAGAVARPRTLAAGDLARLPGQVEDVGALVAGRVGGAVSLRAVLGAAAPLPDATHLTIESGDGRFAASVPLDALAEAVLVYRFGDGPLPAAMGGPARLLIPDAARCGRADVDTCANVKDVAMLRVETARGRDTRPTTPAAHAAVHAKRG